MSRQRLGILLHDFSPGGTERIALRLAGAWSREKRDVVVLCGDPFGALASQVPKNVDLITPESPIRRGWQSRRRLGAWAANACRDFHIDGLMVPGNFHFAAVPRLRAGCGPGLAVICKLSNPIDRIDRAVPARYLAARRMTRRLAGADAVVAMSPALELEARCRLGALPFEMIDEPILDDLRPHSGLHFTRSERQGLISAGRFVGQKDFERAIRTMPFLIDQQVHLTILGDGPDLPRLDRIAAASEAASRIHLPGRVSDVTSWLAKSRVLLLTSRYEGFPAIAVEAIANGVRVVATDCSPAIREIISSTEVGEVVPTGHPRDLAAAVDRQLRQPPVKIEVIQHLNQRFSLLRSAQRYLALFDSI